MNVPNSILSTFWMAFWVNTCRILFYHRAYMSSNLVVTTETFFKVNVSSVYVANSVSCFCPHACFSVFNFSYSTKFVLVLFIVCIRTWFNLLSINGKIEALFCIFHRPYGYSFSGACAYSSTCLFSAYTDLTPHPQPLGLWESIFCFHFVAWAIVLSSIISSNHFKVQYPLSDSQQWCYFIHHLFSGRMFLWPLIFEGQLSLWHMLINKSDRLSSCLHHYQPGAHTYVIKTVAGYSSARKVSNKVGIKYGDFSAPQTSLLPNMRS